LLLSAIIVIITGYYAFYTSLDLFGMPEMFTAIMLGIYAISVYMTISKIKRQAQEIITESKIRGLSNVIVIWATSAGLFIHLAMYFAGFSELNLLTMLFQITVFNVVNALVFFLMIFMKYLTYLIFTTRVKIDDEGIHTGMERCLFAKTVGFNLINRTNRKILWSEIQKFSIINKNRYTIDDVIGLELPESSIEMVLTNNITVKARIINSKQLIKSGLLMSQPGFRGERMSAESLGYEFVEKKNKLGSAFLTVGVTLIIMYTYIMYQFIYYKETRILIYLTAFPYAYILYIILIIVLIYYVKSRKKMGLPG